MELVAAELVRSLVECQLVLYYLVEHSEPFDVKLHWFRQYLQDQ